MKHVFFKNILARLSKKSGTSLMVINQKGVAYSIGDNTTGAFGNNSATPSNSPTQISGNQNFSKTDIETNHGIAIDLNTNTAYTWGDNTNGQLGDNTVVAKSTPVAVSGSKKFIDVSAGVNISAAIDSNGNAWTWGLNSSGQLGNNTITSASSPVSVVGGLKFKQIYAGQDTVIGLTTSNLAYAWGNNFGQLGDNTTTNRSSPVSVYGGRSWKQIFGSMGGSLHTNYGIEYSTGYAWAWGENLNGELGDGTSSTRSSPVSVLGARSFSKIAAYNGIVAAIEGSTGNLYSWGLNTYSALGDGTTASRSSPVSVIGGRSYSEISCFPNGIAAIEASTNNLFVTGRLNTTSALNWLNSIYGASICAPAKISSTRSFSVAVAASSIQALELSTGNAYGWGTGASGHIGDNAATTRSSPSVNASGRNFSFVANYNQGAVISIEKNTGNAYTWGTNSNGQLGDGTISNNSSPVSVLGGRSFTNIVSFGTFTIATEGSTGNAYTWGLNSSGQLGNNTITSASSPVSVVGGRSFKQIFSTTTSQGGIEASTGFIWSWGGNTTAILGNNTISNASSPVSVLGARSFSYVQPVSTGALVAVEASTGYIWGWGGNGNGCLGDGTASGRSSPVSVLGARSFSKIAFAGNGGGISGFAVGIEASTGYAWSWGTNGNGQLGDGTISNRSSPVSVLGARSFSSIAPIGTAVVMAIEGSTGNLYSWGSGASGQLGDNTATNRSSPVLVAGGRSYSKVIPNYSTSAVATCFAIEGSTGNIYSWGTNAAISGYNSATDPTSPVQILSIPSL